MALEPRMLSALSVTLALILGSVAIFHAMRLYTLEDITATDISLLWQLERVGSKYPSDATAYSYYTLLSSAFPTNSYRDEPTERWSVPVWFQNPPGGTEVYCDGMGCIIWNLEGGTNQNTDPCPDVVPYTPNPTPSFDVSTQDLRNELSNTLSQAVNYIINGDGSTFYGLSGYGRAVTMSYTNIQVSRSLLPEGYRYTVVDSLSIGVGDVGRSDIRNRVIMDVVRNDSTETAYCICKDENGNDVVLAQYSVRSVDLDVNARSLDLNEELVSGTITYLKYFETLDWKSAVQGSYNNCVMVIP